MSRYILTGNQGTTALRFPLREGLQVIGRTRDADLTVPDAAISRRHAELRVEDGKVVLKDLGSLNGSFVNGERVNGEIPLAAGDTVRFGQVTLVLVGEDERPRSTLFHDDRASATLTTTFSEIRQRAARSRSDRLLDSLAEAGRILSRRLEAGEIYGKILDVLEKGLDAHRIFVLEPGPDGEHRIVASRVKEMGVEEPLKMSRTMLRDVLVDGRSFLTTDAAGDSQWNAKDSIVRLGVHAAMAAPLFDDDRILGAIYVDSRKAGVSYAAEDLNLLTLLAHMTAVKMTQSRLEKEEAALTLLRQELGLAARIQMNLLPKEIPALEGYSIFAHQSPCQSVGGDLYEVRVLPDGRVWMALGDVTGHGVGAALLMSSAMAGIRILADQCPGPFEMVKRLEEHLSRQVEMGQFVTLFAGVLEPETGKLEYVNAGHVPPFLIGAKGRTPLPATGLPVALLPDGPERDVATCTLDPGTTLLVISDGVSECVRGPDQYDEGRFQAFLDRWGAADAEITGRALLADVEDFSGGAPAEDDLTVLVVHRKA